MPTAVVRYVDTMSSGGGNGTTEDHTGANAAYPTASSWESSEQADLVFNDQTHTVYCSGSDPDTTLLNLLTWTTDSTRFVTVAANRSATNNDGFYSGPDLISESHYRIETTSIPITINGGLRYTVIDGIQCVLTSDTNDLQGIRCWQGTLGFKVLRCRVQARSTTATGQVGIGDDNVSIGDGATGTIDSNIIAGFNYGIKRNLFISSTTDKIYNNTVYGSRTTGIHIDNGGSAGGAIEVKNNLVFGSAAGDDWSLDTTGATMTADNNASVEDISSIDGNWVDLSSYAESDICTSPSTAIGADFSLVASGPCANAGIAVGEAADAYDQIRTAPYDVGAVNNDKISIPAAMHTYRRLRNG